MTKGNPLLMPKLGLTMTEGVLASWAVKVGTQVRTGDVLFTVETDKIATEVEARADGEILSIDVFEGETVPVGAVLARWTGASAGIEDDAETHVTVPDLPAEAAPVGVGPSRSPAGERIRSTPLARRLASRAGIELSQITGSGPNGRIKAIDVERAQAKQTAAAHDSEQKQAATGAPSGALRRPATRMEQTVARRLTQSKQTIPHFYVFADVDITQLVALRTTLNADAAPQTSKLSMTHLLASGLARSLAAMPELNAVWDDGHIIRFESIDIGIAVDSLKGLLVPVIRAADTMGIDAMAQAMSQLVDKARDGALVAADVEGGAISISNVGMFGASALAPIINPGQSAILGVGRPKQVFRPDADGQPTLCEELTLILSCDHRIYDGVRAARLLDHLTQLLENPLRLLRS
jgi:pyruvate dehydrogenase E2 component (dihydrolipoamide acetyltransferase)